ncbi:MAG: hypothetical protein ACXVGN_00215 [Mycobacteriaceae bacterium]
MRYAGRKSLEFIDFLVAAFCVLFAALMVVGILWAAWTQWVA